MDRFPLAFCFYPPGWLTLDRASVACPVCGFPVMLGVLSMAWWVRVLAVVLVGVRGWSTLPSVMAVCFWGQCSSGSPV